MLELEEAQQRIVVATQPLRIETIRLTQAAGRFLSEPIRSPLDLPLFDNSAMDGYAVRADDLKSADPLAPARLRLIGKVAAGEKFAGTLTSQTCVRIFTGSPLPAGADSVIMQEDVEIAASDPATVLFHEPAKPWGNIRLQGEDVRTGDTLAPAGEKLTPGKISLLAAAGIETIKTWARPTVALLATGSELREAGQTLLPGQIFESNRAALASMTLRCGADAVPFPLVADHPDVTARALEKAFAECDIVVTSGGVSVGEFDFVKTAFEKLGGKLDFWKISIRPGKPFVFGQWRGKFLFGLPGNPVSALVTFWLLARPALLRLQGANSLAPPSQTGILREPLSNPGERRHFIRVTIDAQREVASAGPQASHLLSSLARANGLVDVPPKTTWPAKTSVRVLMWE